MSAELGHVVAGLKPGRATERQRIVSMNMGIALEDVAMARRIYTTAIERRTGTWLA